MSRKVPLKVIPEKVRSQRVAALPKQLQRRVKLTVPTVNAIKAKTEVMMDADGKLRYVGPDGKPIPGNKATYDKARKQVIYGDINYGHLKDKSLKGYQDDTANQNKRSEVNTDQNNPDIYQIEWQKTNSSNGAKGDL